VIREPDEDARLTKVKEAAGQESTYAYDGGGLKRYETDRRGVSREFTYDNLGRPRITRLSASPFSNVAWSQETECLDGAIPTQVHKDAHGGRAAMEARSALDREIGR
jgi:YD repeat-containing protein